MPLIETEYSIRHFQQLRNRQNQFYRKNTSALIKAAKAGDRDTVDRLRAARIQIQKNDVLIMDAEQTFVSANLGQSDAERELGKQTRRANRLVSQIKSVASLLSAIGEMTTIITRLIKIFV